MKTSLKDWPKVYERIKRVRVLDEHEKFFTRAVWPQRRRSVGG